MMLFSITSCASHQPGDPAHAWLNGTWTGQGGDWAQEFHIRVVDGNGVTGQMRSCRLTTGGCSIWGRIEGTVADDTVDVVVYKSRPHHYVMHRTVDGGLLNRGIILRKEGAPAKVTLPTKAVEGDDAETLLRKARAVAGRAPTSRELKDLLLGNRLCYDRELRYGGHARRCYHYLTGDKLISDDERQGKTERSWSVTPDDRYCHDDIRGDDSCFGGVKVETRDGSTIHVTMVRLQGRKKGEPAVYTLLPGGKR